MSRQVINQYYTKLERIIQYGGSRNETAIRSALYSLINEYANKKNLELTGLENVYRRNLTMYCGYQK